MAFLAGSALKDLDHSSLNRALLSIGVATFILFALFTFLAFRPVEGNLFLDAKVIRDRYVWTSDEDRPQYAYEAMRVKWQLIGDADKLIKENIVQARRYRLLLWGMLTMSAASILSWSLLIAYASPAAAS